MAKTTQNNFYDIESVLNVFSLANWRPSDNELDLYLLLDDQAAFFRSPHITPGAAAYIKKRIWEKNRNFTGQINLYDLHEFGANHRLARTFGLWDARRVNDPSQRSVYADGIWRPPEIPGAPMARYDAPTACFRPACDTDPEYIADPSPHPFLMGYNSANFDTTLLAAYFLEAFPVERCPDPAPGNPNRTADRPVFRPATAAAMRAIDNCLFSEKFNKSMPSYLAYRVDPRTNGWDGPDYSLRGWKIRRSMLMSGRQVDVARLNEKQQHVGLKRIIGILGGQILESDKLKPGQDFVEDLDQLADLLAYNASDVVNLDLVVFRHKLYASQFTLKRGLLKTYPELVYEKLPNAYAPDIRPQAVRNDRLFPDSSSAQLAAKALCPYGHLPDIRAVSFLYPSEAKSKELGIPRENVLEKVDKAFRTMFRDYPAPLAAWEKIRRFYKAVEGRNFNESESYLQDFGEDALPVSKVSDLPRTDTCIPYFGPDGEPTSCFAAFSIGGIHGAEYNKAKYDADMAGYEKDAALMAVVQATYPDPLDLKRHLKETKSKSVAVGGIEYPASRFLKSGSTMKSASYKTLSPPVLFASDDKSKGTKLNAGRNGYAYTSADPTSHEDFESYYPNMLRMMSAFHNEGLGYDRYAEIFDNKQDYGFLMKEKNARLSPEDSRKYAPLREAACGTGVDPFLISEAEREAYVVLREGTKLILNSASGAADAKFDSNIRMNNQIMSMRCIGQLFTYLIAQSQTFRGARITSTNTDGLFSVMDFDENARILARESKNIGVKITPEPTYLISKDTNNRIELDPGTRRIQAAGGGTVGCWSGPNPAKALSHPAIIDWALSQYLIQAALGDHGLSLADPFSDRLGREILERSYAEFPDPVRWLNMFQNVVASSPGTKSFVYYITDADPRTPVPMQHYNRVFIMKDGTPDTVHLRKASQKKITPATAAKRAKEDELPQQHDPEAAAILEANGVNVRNMPLGYEAAVSKCTNIDDAWCMRVENGALDQLVPDQVRYLVDGMDMEKYLLLLRNAYVQSWKNDVPGHVDVLYE